MTKRNGPGAGAESGNTTAPYDTSPAREGVWASEVQADTLQAITDASSWEAAADAIGPSVLTVMKFGDGWKAMYGTYDYVRSYGYLASCRPRLTVEQACKDLIFRDRVVPGMGAYDALRIEEAWRCASFDKVTAKIVEGLKHYGWAGPLSDEQTKAYEQIMDCLGLAMGAY